jgi:hypothetical protein
MKYEIGDLVWLHSEGWGNHPLLVIGILGDQEHIQVMSTKDNGWVMTFVPYSLHTQPLETI